MTIELLSKEDYNILLNIQKKHNILTFQNKGYQYIDKSKFTQEDSEAFKIVSEILKSHINGFVEFNNFLFDKKGELNVRIQYKWDERFTGVGYAKIDELLNGFNN